MPPVVTPSKPMVLTPEANQNDNMSGIDGGRGVVPHLLPPVMPVHTLTPPTTVAASPSSEIVHGFARQVPLAVALREILPAGYAFSIDADVDMGILVSFQGGRPWRDTLRDSLEPAGLVMREAGQMVTIGRADSMAIAPAMPVKTSSRALPSPHLVEVPVVQNAQSTASPVPLTEPWRADRGDNLHRILETWCSRAGVELDWMAEYDYPLQASISFSGSFEEAVRSLLSGFENAHPQPIAELHINSNLGQKVLVIGTRGNSNTD